MNDFTMVIATKNRHKYLERALEYYSSADIRILVADATTARYRQALPPNATYHHYPDVPYCEKLSDVFKKVDTKYSMLAADDDFILPSGIAACIDFLQNNSGYNSAQGHYLFFRHSGNRLFYSTAYASTIGADFNEETAEERIHRYNRTAIQFYYCIHQTETLRTVFNAAGGHILNLNLVELLLGMATVIRGKHKVLPVFYSVRELLYGSAGKSAGLNVLKTDPQFAAQYRTFFNAISGMLAATEKIPTADAEKFLADSIERHIRFRYPAKPTIKTRATMAAKKILPFSLRKKVQHLTLLLKGNTDAASLLTQTRDHDKGSEKQEISRIENLIFKYNIHQ